MVKLPVVLYTMFMLGIILLQGGLLRAYHDASYVALPAREIRIRTSGELRVFHDFIPMQKIVKRE